MASIKTNNAPAAIGPYSQGVVVDNLVFVSGQLPINPATGNFAEGDASVHKKYRRNPRRSRNRT